MTAAAHRYGFPMSNNCNNKLVSLPTEYSKRRVAKKEMPEDVDEVGYSFIYTNEEVQRITKTMPLRDFTY